MDKQDYPLPPRPGEKPAKQEVKGIPFIVYLNGKPVELSKKEALSVMAQIVNIMMYLDEQPGEKTAG